MIVSDVNEAGGHESARLIQQRGGTAAFCAADVRNESQVRDLIAFADERYGGVDILVNNASAPSGKSDGLDDWLDPLETDLLGAIYATRSVIASMRRRSGGAIVNIASISALWHGRTTPGGLPGYDVAKAGLIRMTTGLARLAKTDGIRVNCLAPGWIATDGPRQYWESLTPSERSERGVPARLLTVDEVADAVVRLAQDRSLAGRVLVWWSEDAPHFIQWGDRGYREFESF